MAPSVQHLTVDLSLAELEVKPHVGLHAECRALLKQQQQQHNKEGLGKLTLSLPLRTHALSQRHRVWPPPSCGCAVSLPPTEPPPGRALS